MIIAIDGPAGSGKSTVAAQLASKLGVAFLDTGAMYRAVTLAGLNRDESLLDDEQKTSEMVAEITIEMKSDAETNRIYLDGEDISEEIRTTRVTNHAHKVAKNAGVREQLVIKQQEIGQSVGSLVTEGRDQGTVVFPNAEFKFYLDASPECRAKRRWKQLQAKGQTVTYEEILNDQIIRDKRDMTRETAPLKAADDARIIDTTEMTLEEVIETLYSIVTETK